MRLLAGDDQERKQAFRETLTRQFRELVKALTACAPKPAPRRRRRDDTGRAFRMTARKIMRCAARLPPAAYAAPEEAWGTLDRLNPWHHDTTTELVESGPEAEPGHLSLHL